MGWTTATGCIKVALGVVTTVVDGGGARPSTLACFGSTTAVGFVVGIADFTEPWGGYATRLFKLIRGRPCAPAAVIRLYATVEESFQPGVREP